MIKRALFLLIVLAAGSPALASAGPRSQQVDALVREVGRQVKTGKVPQAPIMVSRTYHAGLLTGRAFVDAVRGTEPVRGIDMNARTNAVASPAEATAFLIEHVRTQPADRVNRFSISEAISDIAKAKIELELASAERAPARAGLLRQSAAARLSVFRGKVRGVYTQPEISVGVAALRAGLFSAEVHPDAPIYLSDAPERRATRAKPGVEALLAKITRQMSDGRVPRSPITVAATDQNRLVIASDLVDAVARMQHTPAIDLRAKGIAVGTPDDARDLIVAYVHRFGGITSRYGLGQIGDRLADIAKARVELAAAEAETGNPARQAALRQSAALRLEQFPGKLLRGEAYPGTPPEVQRVRAELFPHPIFPDFF